MNKTQVIYGICCIMMIMVWGCNSDTTGGEIYKLEGKWQIFEAMRNNEVTTTLDDGYFSFRDSTMETNIMGSPISGKFKLIGNIISHESELPVDYEIESYHGDTLELGTSIRGFDFIFKVVKEDTATIN
jgi:hypothetical protein